MTDPNEFIWQSSPNPLGSAALAISQAEMRRRDEEFNSHHRHPEVND